MTVAMFCYITDITNEVERSSRLIFFETSVLLGMFFGTASCSFVLQFTSTTATFLISATLVSLATIFIIVSADESLPTMLENVSSVQKLKEIFSAQPIKEMLISCFKPRPNNGRKILWCLLTIIILTKIASGGSDNVFYLFTRQKFQWSLRELTIFSSTLMILATFGNIAGVKVFKELLGLSDHSIILIAIVSKILDSLGKAFAESTQQMFIISAIVLFKGLAPVMCKSVISTIVSRNEIGKIFSVMASIEAVSSLISSPVYTFVYTQTIVFFPAAFFLINLFLSLTNLGLAILVAKYRNI